MFLCGKFRFVIDGNANTRLAPVAYNRKKQNPKQSAHRETRANYARNGGRYDGNSKGNSSNKCSGKKRQQGQNKTGVPETGRPLVVLIASRVTKRGPSLRSG